MTFLYRLSTLAPEVYSYRFAFSFAPFWTFLALFGPCWAIFGVGIKFKNFFGTYLHSLTTFTLEVKLYFACQILFRMVESVGSGRVGSGGRMGVEIKTNSAQLKLELGFGLSLAISTDSKSIQ